jgi:hypothetical protein
MSKTKRYLMQKIEADELIFNESTGIYEPNLDNPKFALAFAEAEFESSLAAMRNALAKLDAGMPKRIEAGNKIAAVLKQTLGGII